MCPSAVGPSVGNAFVKIAENGVMQDGDVPCIRPCFFKSSPDKARVGPYVRVSQPSRLRESAETSARVGRATQLRESSARVSRASRPCESAACDVCASWPFESSTRVGRASRPL